MTSSISISFELIVLVGDALFLINDVNEFSLSLGRSAAATRWRRTLNLCMMITAIMNETTKTAQGSEI